MKDSITYSDMAEELPAVMMVARHGIIRSSSDKEKRLRKILDKGQVSLPPDLLSPRNLPKRHVRQTLLDIVDPYLWIFGQAREGFQLRSGQRGLQMGGVCTVAGSTTGRQNVCQGKNAQTFKTAGAEIKELGSKEASEELVNNRFNPGWIALWLMERILL